RPPFLVRESADGSLPRKRGIPSPYIVLAFPLLLPIAELPWRVAICVWVVLSLFATGVVSWMLVKLVGGSGRNQLVFPITISVLLLAPIQTAIATSNIVTIVFAIGMVAAFCVTEKRSGSAG